MVLISCPHTNAERMSECDKAASLLAAGVHAADEGAGCLERQEVLDEGGEMRDSTKLGGVASTGLPEHERVMTRSGPWEVTRTRSRRGRAGEGNESTRKPLKNAVEMLGGAR